jgi:hypothetical protein
MDWPGIRAHYERILQASQKTQVQIGTASGLRQTDISKFLRARPKARDLGPHVQTFVKAIEGLGLSVSEFFAQIEGPRPVPGRAALPIAKPAPPVDRDTRLEHTIVTTLRRLAQLLETYEDRVRTR